MKFLGIISLLTLLILGYSCSSSGVKTAYKECVSDVGNIFGLPRLKAMKNCFDNHRY